MKAVFKKKLSSMLLMQQKGEKKERKETISFASDNVAISSGHVVPLGEQYPFLFRVGSGISLRSTYMIYVFARISVMRAIRMPGIPTRAHRDTA